MKFEFKRGLFKKPFIIEVEDSQTSRLMKILGKDFISPIQPTYRLVEEIIRLRNKKAILSYALSSQILEKEKVEETSMHINMGPRKKHIWTIGLKTNIKNKHINLIHGTDR